MISELAPSSRRLEGSLDLESVYLHPRSRHLRVNFVASLDGAIEIDGRSGALGRPSDRAAFQAMRAVADAILVGAGTVRDEDYGPVRLDTVATGRRIERGQPEVPTLAIVSSQAQLSVGAKVFSGPGRPLILTSGEAISQRPDLAEVAEMVSCGEDHVDLALAIDALGARGLGRVVCEGGPTLFRSLLVAGLVDELCLTHAPVLVGAERRQLTGNVPLPETLTFHLTGLLHGDGLLLARYARGPEDPGSPS